jgi:hypothetical protein
MSKVHPRITALTLIGAQALIGRQARAWLFVEHTSVGRAAFASTTAGSCQPSQATGGVTAPVSEKDRKVLQAAWNALRAAEFPIGVDLSPDVAQPDAPIELSSSTAAITFSPRVDLPMLAALGGDHSCSERDLDATLRTSWVTPLVQMFIKNYEAIRATPAISPQRVNLWHESHLLAQGLDSKYLFRATTSHFLLGRRWMRDTQGKPVPESVNQYVKRVSQGGAAINAIGAYVNYHARALRAASAARCTADACADPGAARDTLLLEAIALHFLEDSFASGHIAGVPSDESDAARIGTHDYYCEHGLSAQPWRGEPYPAFGDAHLRAEDKLATREGVGRSLSQVAAVLAGGQTPCEETQALDVCADTTVPATSDACVAFMVAVVEVVPAPPLTPTPVAPARNDIGAFVRFAVGADGGLGLTARSTVAAHGSPRVAPTWGVNADVGIGLSLAGVTTGWSDAVVALEGGLAGVAGQRTDFCLTCENAGQQPLDTRLGEEIRLRMPFEFVPGDFPLVALAYLVFREPSIYTRLVEAANGGFYGRWQRIWTFPNGMGIQFVAGREAAYAGYNLSRALAASGGLSSTFYHSDSWTFPLVDWLWTRHYAESFGAQLKMRLSYRYEHSDVLDSHFLLFSFTSDSDLYFTGF